jgi:hypothetical protein
VPRLLGQLALPLALALMFSGSARAQPVAGLTLHWSGPPECPMPAETEAEIAALLPPGFEPEHAPAFEVRIEGLPDGSYRLQLRVPREDLTSVRTLRSCAEAAEAAAVLIAMALESAPAVPPAPAPLPEPSGAEPRDDAPPAEQPRARGGWALTAAALGDVRSLPRPSVGVMLGALWSVRALRLAWYGRYLPAQPVEGLPSGATAQLDLYAFALNAALLWKLSAFTFGPAVEVELGYLRGQASGVEAARRAGAAWAAIAGGGVAEVRLHERISLQFGALLGVPWWESRFAFRDESTVFTSKPVVFRWFLGVGVRVGPTG